jgi:acyl transferase domain-containing protein
LLTRKLGTASGDPTEANWVGECFKRDKEVLIGSVKGNIGLVHYVHYADYCCLYIFSSRHLEITAFLASLCKVCGIFGSGMIPPNVNFHVPNPAIKWKKYGLCVPTYPIRLPCYSPSGRSLISLASSGIGGANGHCVVESPPPPRVLEPFWTLSLSEVPHLFIAGALSPRSAISLAEDLKHTVGRLDPRSISLILGRRSRSMPWKSYSLLTKGNLKKFSEPGLTHGGRDMPLVFVFSGQGPQHFHSEFVRVY